MVTSSSFDQAYHICTIDIGSPKLGNLGWCLHNIDAGQNHLSDDLDALFPIIANGLTTKGMILGLEAPLFVPLREDLMLATKARKGEGRRPWSAGAGAQVLALNLPIMIYILEGIKKAYPDVTFFVNEDSFEAKAGQIMLFEALVSGKDKGTSHMEDAEIMVNSCFKYSKQKKLPASILKPEEQTTFFNLVAAALLRCDLENDVSRLNAATPIYKPD